MFGPLIDFECTVNLMAQLTGLPSDHTGTEISVTATTSIAI